MYEKIYLLYPKESMGSVGGAGTFVQNLSQWEEGCVRGRKHVWSFL
jgi:hypothetical protein